MANDSKLPEPGPPRSRFPGTHWSLVLQAGRDSSPGARDALGGLYEMYRGPLLSYLLWKGSTNAEAQDLLHGFFESLLERRGLSSVEKRGHFRSWLLTSLQNYVRDVWIRSQAIKRGGGQEHESLDAMAAKGMQGPAHPGRSPEREYERQCALQFLQRVIARLAEEFHRKGKSRLFEVLSPYLLEGKGEISQAALGQQLGMEPDAVSQAIHRLRQRFQKVFREELAFLIGEGADLEAEARFLVEAVEP